MLKGTASQSLAMQSRPQPNFFSPEFKLVVACASTKSSLGVGELISQVRDGETFLHLTSHHRLVPQVYRRLSGAQDLVPEQFLDRLRSLYLANVRQTLRLTRDLHRVLKHFEVRGIPVLAYKGPALASMFRGDVERQFSDLDLLVDRRDVKKAKLALFELGYTQPCPLTKAEEESYLDSGYEMAFDLPDAKNVLELKWRILPKFYAVDFHVKDFFARSLSVDVDGCPVRTLSPEDLLLVLCVHAAKHAWSELSLLCDISRLVQSQPLNWHRVSSSAKRLGLERIMGITFGLIERLFEVKLYPQRVQRHTQQAASNVLNLISKSRQMDTESFAYFRLMIQLRERWRDRLRFFFRLLLTPGPGEWRVLRLPARLFSFYHLVRFWRLGAKLVRTLRRQNDVNFSAELKALGS